jgi:hypothetical protein
VRYLYLKEGAIGETKSQWEEFFKEKVVVKTREEAVASGLFGSKVTERNLDRIGDLVVIAQDELILVEPDREELQLSMVGHHGGTTRAEQEIPLMTQLI